MTINILETPVYKRLALANFSAKLDGFLDLFGEYVERRKLKAILGPLSESELRDIGLTKAEVLSLENLSLKESSREKIATVQKARNGKW